LAASFNRPRAGCQWRLVRQDPGNLKPGDFDKPPGKPRQYYWMNDYGMKALFCSGRGRGVYPENHWVNFKLNVYALLRTAATISRNEKISFASVQQTRSNHHIR